MSWEHVHGHALMHGVPRSDVDPTLGSLNKAAVATAKHVEMQQAAICIMHSGTWPYSAATVHANAWHEVVLLLLPVLSSSAHGVMSIHLLLWHHVRASSLLTHALVDGALARHALVGVAKLLHWLRQQITQWVPVG